MLIPTLKMPQITVRQTKFVTDYGLVTIEVIATTLVLCEKRKMFKRLIITDITVNFNILILRNLATFIFVL